MTKIFMKLSLFIIFAMAASFSLAGEQSASLISVTGEAELFVEPDEITVSLTVEVQGKDLKSVQTKNDDITAKVLRVAIDKLRIDKKYVQTNHISIHPVYGCSDAKLNNRRCQTQELQYYKTQKGIKIKLKDAELLQKLLDKSVEAGVARINSISFSYSDEDTLKRKARVVAAADAKEKAEDVAQVLGVEVGGPHTIRINHIGSSSANLYKGARFMAMEAAGSEASNTIELGQISIKAQVSVDFEIDK